MERVELDDVCGRLSKITRIVVVIISSRRSGSQAGHRDGDVDDVRVELYLRNTCSHQGGDPLQQRLAHSRQLREVGECKVLRDGG